MRFKAKFILLAFMPLGLSLALIALAVLAQRRDLAQRERQWVQSHCMKAPPRQAARPPGPGAEHRHAALRVFNRAKPQVREVAVRRLSTLDQGRDGYFSSTTFRGFRSCIRASRSGWGATSGACEIRKGGSPFKSSSNRHSLAVAMSTKRTDS